MGLGHVGGLRRGCRKPAMGDTLPRGALPLGASLPTSAQDPLSQARHPPPLPPPLLQSGL